MTEQIYNPEDPRTPTEIACKSLTKEAIEDMLHEKINDVYLYMHYDVSADLGKNVPADNQIAYQQETDVSQISGRATKSILENKMPQIDLTISATKVIQTQQASGINSHQILGNIIFRDKITGKFHALNDWVSLEFDNASYIKPSYAAAFNKLFSKLRRAGKVKSDDKLMQTVIGYKIYEALSKARGLSR